MIRRFRQHVKRSSLVTEVLESVDPHGYHLNMYSRTAYTQILRLMISAATAERTGANTRAHDHTVLNNYHIASQG